MRGETKPCRKIFINQGAVAVVSKGYKFEETNEFTFPWCWPLHLLIRPKLFISFLIFGIITSLHNKLRPIRSLLNANISSCQSKETFCISSLILMFLWNFKLEPSVRLRSSRYVDLMALGKILSFVQPEVFSNLSLTTRNLILLCWISLQLGFCNLLLLHPSTETAACSYGILYQFLHLSSVSTIFCFKHNRIVRDFDT